MTVDEDGWEVWTGFNSLFGPNGATRCTGADAHRQAVQVRGPASRALMTSDKSRSAASLRAPASRPVRLGSSPCGHAGGRVRWPRVSISPSVIHAPTWSSPRSVTAARFVCTPTLAPIWSPISTAGIPQSRVGVAGCSGLEAFDFTSLLRGTTPSVAGFRRSVNLAVNMQHQRRLGVHREGLGASRRFLELLIG